MQTIYFDNAATSWPKPQSVIKAVNDFLQNSGGNPGRSGHRLSLAAGEIILDCREKLTALLGVKNPMLSVFTNNATSALNYAILGVLKQNDHVIISSIEHNSVLRPLQQLQNDGKISYSIWSVNPDNPDDLSALLPLIKTNTKLIIANHSSNVNGMILSIRLIGDLCKKRKILFLVDASQSAGSLSIDLNADNIDLLALAGHKGLYGPPGTGALIINDDFDLEQIRPIITGGTGSLSSSLEQPDFLPDKLESGTPNGCGIAGLSSGIDFVNSIGLTSIQNHKQKLADYLAEKLLRQFNANVKLYQKQQQLNSGVVSFNLRDCDSSVISNILSDEYNVMSRSGLHCAPFAHKTIGSYPHGTLRFSFSWHNTIEEIDYAITALQKIYSLVK